MVVSGTNVNFDQDGNYPGMLDANSIMLALDALVKERKLDPANILCRSTRSIRPAHSGVALVRAPLAIGYGHQLPCRFG